MVCVSLRVFEAGSPRGTAGRCVGLGEVLRSLGPEDTVGRQSFCLSAAQVVMETFALTLAPCHWHLASPEAQSNGTGQPWTGSSRIVSQDRPFLFMHSLSQLFCCSNVKLTHSPS